MSFDVVTEWKGELVRRLSSEKAGDDKRDIESIAHVERTLVDFLHDQLLRNITSIFPGSNWSEQGGSFLFGGEVLVLEHVGRYQTDSNSLCIILNRASPRPQEHDVVRISGLPSVSGIRDCLIFLPKGITVDVSLVRLLITTTFDVGYEWATHRLKSLVARHFDRLGSKLYNALDLQLLAFAPDIKKRTILTFYYKDVEYPVLDSSIIPGFIKSIRASDDLYPLRGMLEFSKFFLSSVRDSDSPFREAIRTGQTVFCRLPPGEAVYYNAAIDFNRVMRSIYDDEVALYPLVITDQIVLGCNLHRTDLELIRRTLDNFKPLARDIIQNNRREILHSIRAIEALSIAFERQGKSRTRGLVIATLQNLPDIYEVVSKWVEGMSQNPPF